MFESIEKRDKRIVEFDSSKITAAIAKAGNATSEFTEREAKKLTLRALTLAHELRLGPIPKVEEIQDIVERVLLDSPFYKTAKAYILYREQHAQIRKITTRANVDLVNHYIEKLDWKIRENSNMSYSLQGLNNYISSEVTSEYWLNSIYPPEVRAAHAEGDIHIHDLNLLSVYCVGWDLMDLLRQGFKGVEGKVESSPPLHLRSALGQIVNFFYTLQGEAAGAQAISNFDTLLAPFVRADHLEYKDVKQALQEFIFNINIPTRVGFQTPFTNITLDLTVPTTLKDHPVVVGGRERAETYADFLKLVLDNSDLRLLRNRPDEAAFTEEQKERRHALFGILVSIFERAYVMVYEPNMNRQRRRLWQTWDDYISEWCARADYRSELPELLKGEDPDFAAYMYRSAGMSLPA